MQPFDTNTYLDAQVHTFGERMGEVPANGRVYIEFGGKPVDDQHAARVLPGYDPDVKMKLLSELHLNASTSVVVSVSARDLLRPRIRGDSKLFYNLETIALIRRLNSAGIAVDAGVITMVDSTCSAKDRDTLDCFRVLAKRELGIGFVEYPKIPKYPDLHSTADWSIWNSANRLEIPDRRHVLVLSPGGGSGKFGVCLAELYRDYVDGVNSTYLKFETFPVFDLAPDHAVNRAFVAATADLGNTLQSEQVSGLTCYDKDIGNFALLCRVHGIHCPEPASNPITRFREPSDMSVNRLSRGFVDERSIISAAELEIQRRILRYEEEVRQGLEHQSTLSHLRSFA